MNRLKEVRVYCKSVSCKQQGNGLVISFSSDVKEGLAVSAKSEKIQVSKLGSELPVTDRGKYNCFLCLQRGSNAR